MCPAKSRRQAALLGLGAQSGSSWARRCAPRAAGTGLGRGPAVGPASLRERSGVGR